MSATTVWFNPRCSKCRALREILEERGVEADYRLYLEQPPTRGEIEQLLTLLGSSDPTMLMRSKEAAWTELSLEQADASRRVDAICERPELLERPIVVHDGRAVVARPPEKVLDLLD